VVAVAGNGILQENGEVDHAKLREIVFSDTTKHKQLNRFVFFSFFLLFCFP
jgi:dephospho-CoA kinase